MGKFVVKESAKGFMFNLKAGNGEVIAAFEVYHTQGSFLNGLESAKKNAPEAELKKTF